MLSLRLLTRALVLEFNIRLSLVLETLKAKVLAELALRSVSQLASHFMSILLVNTVRVKVFYVQNKQINPSFFFYLLVCPMLRKPIRGLHPRTF